MSRQRITSEQAQLDNLRDVRNRADERVQKRSEVARWRTRIGESATQIYFHGQSIEQKYGLTNDDFVKLFERQGRTCAICKNDATRNNGRKYLSVDHNHETGAIRGLLCAKCNAGIGFFDDNPSWLRAAAKYLDTQ